MISFSRKILKSERGQALPLVLALFAIGGLTIASSLNYATTSLNAERILDESVKGVYAAEAGVEHVLWSLENRISPATQLPENVNQMGVNMITDSAGVYTLIGGELRVVEETAHPEWVDVEGDMVPEGNRYKYTITATWQCPDDTKIIKLFDIGARIPNGYVYDDSASIASDNASEDDHISFDNSTFHQSTDNLSVWWIWDPPGQAPAIHVNNQVLWLSFYITGSGNQDGDYAWVESASQDIGPVGEFWGERNTITATATRPEDGRTTAKIEVEAMVMPVDEKTYILSWQILH